MCSGIWKKIYIQPMSTAFLKTGARKFSYKLFRPFFGHHTVAITFWQKISFNPRDLLSAF
jgi:hypothetical protein